MVFDQMINPRVGMPVRIAIYYLEHDITNSLKSMKKKAKKVNKLKLAKSAKAKKSVKAKKK